MKQGDIILVLFPFTDLSSQKTRPALVISKKKETDQDIIVTAITSKKSKKAVKIDNVNLSKGQLPITSYVRYDKVVTLHKSLIKKTVAHIKPKTLNEIIKKFKSLF